MKILDLFEGGCVVRKRMYAERAEQRDAQLLDVPTG